MKYFLQAIEENRHLVRLTDQEIKDLLIACRNPRDDRIEFHESMTRLVEELRNSEHAAAFLTKVAKRDAPDYYDVIKSPMDLGTMLRNIKSGRYKTKAQFMRDLDLIWDNCLTYNSEPTHPLRYSVQVMRNKANHLLTYVHDSNDIREILQNWNPSGSSKKGSTSNQGMAPSFGSDLPTENGLSNGGPSMINGRSMSLHSKRFSTSAIDTPFEQRPAVLRSAEGMNHFSTFDEALSQTDAEFQEFFSSSSSIAGPSREPMNTLKRFEVGDASSSTSSVLVRDLESYGHDGVLYDALTQSTLDKGKEEEKRDGRMTNGTMVELSSKKGKKHSPSKRIDYPLQSGESSNGTANGDRFLGAWWNSTGHTSLLPNGMTPSSTSVRIKQGPLRLIGEQCKSRKKRKTSHSTSDAFGGDRLLEKNVMTVTKLRKTHAKFGSLLSHLENEEPIPAALAVVSSDESEGEDDDDGGDVGKREGAKHKRSNRNYHKEVDIAVSEPFMYDSLDNPFRKLNTQSAKEVTLDKTMVLIAHAGFEASQASAAGVLADVVGEYISNIGRTLRLYLDHYCQEMGGEELILHTLFQNGGMSVRTLESYIVDDVMRRGAKLGDLLSKLQSSYKEKIANTTLNMEDEAYFAEGNSDQIMEGGFAQNMGDDFFGFKELGLDKELGVDMSQLVVPHRLFNKGAGVASGSSSRMNGTVAGRIGGGGGGASNGAGAALGGGAKNVGGGEAVLFDPPPPFIALTDAAIQAQIGILQGFYRDLTRTRGQYHSTSRKGVGAGGEYGEEEDDEDDDDEEDDEEGEGREHRSRNRGQLVLLEEEMERQRYKVPPNGKMPKRAMKIKGEMEKRRQSGTNGNNNTANSAKSTLGSEKVKNGSSSTTMTTATTATTSATTTTSKKKKKKSSA
ncbi:hypothetical protein CBS101457_005664 [Exobasidium rhododendri]|nr:hypothetical protein CBS101457_005664 [Exobasidium rhododendri]